MINTKTTMKLAHFHDFYYLQALQHAIGNEIATNPDLEFSKSVEKLRGRVDELAEDISANIALRTFVYLYVACVGEARHASSSEAKTLYIEQVTQKHHREKINLDTLNYRPTKDNIAALVRVFDQTWGSGFGGSAWKAIAGALYTYYSMPAASFIDHVVDLASVTRAFGGPSLPQTSESDWKR